MLHSTMKTLAIVESIPVVIAEGLLIEVPEKMERFDANVGAADAALEQAPEAVSYTHLTLPTICSV